MKHSIEIRFDAKAEEAIRSIWASAATTYATTYVLRNGVIPHMALLVGDETIGQVFAEFQCPFFEVRLSVLGFFAAGSVVYVHCPLTNDVIVFHRELYDRAMAKGASVDKLYAPGRWVPHCTIAQACQTNLMKGIRFRPIVARARSMIHVMYPPTTLLAEKSCHVKQAAGPDACSTGEL